MTRGHSSHGLLLECTDGFMSSISQAPEGCSEDVSGFLGGGRDRVRAAFIELGCHSPRRAASARDPPKPPPSFLLKHKGTFRAVVGAPGGEGRVCVDHHHTAAQPKPTLPDATHIFGGSFPHLFLFFDFMGRIFFSCFLHVWVSWETDSCECPSK